MKYNYFLVPVITVLLLTSVSSVLAVDKPTTTPGKRPEINQVKKEVKTDLKVKTTQTKLETQRKIAITSQAGIYNSFTKRAEAQHRYQDLIQKRLTQKSTKIGKELTAAQASLDSLAPLWTKYDKDLATFKTTLDSLSTATDLKSVVLALKIQAKQVNQDLKDIHSTLVNTLRLIVKAK